MDPKRQRPLPMMASSMRSAPGSRLPVRMPQPPNNPRGMSAPSKLEELRKQYQAQLEKAKTQKLQELYQNNPPPSNKALIRINNNNTYKEDTPSSGFSAKDFEKKGNVRDFFRERRAFEGKPKPLPNGYSTKRHNTFPGSQKPPIPNTHQTGVGRDRSKPLAPISRENSSVGSRDPSPFGGTYTLDKEGKKVPFNRKATLARGHKKQEAKVNESDVDDENNPHKHEPKPSGPPSSGKRKVKNFREWQEEQRKRKEELAQQEDEDSAPQSDFQKWQQQQDQAKTDRLQKYHNQQDQAPVVNQEFKAPSRNDPTPRSKGPTPRSKDPTPRSQVRQQKQAILKQKNKKFIEYESDEDEDEGVGEDEEEEMKRQEAALRDQIARQKAELTRLREQREKEEQIEKKRQAAEAARREKLAAQQQRLREQEQLRQQEEEEKLQQLAALNNNNQQLIQQAANPNTGRTSSRVSSKQSNKMSNRTYDLNEDDREESPSKFFPTKPVRPHSRSRKMSVDKKNKKNERFIKQQKEPEPDPEEPELPKQDMTAFYAAAAQEDGANEVVNLQPCSNCGRKFAAERLAKHAKVCKDSAKKLAKRKVFDPVKMRTQGTEAAQYARNAKTVEKPKKSNWRTQHENFVKTIRYAKAVSEAEKDGGSAANLPPPPVTENPDYKQCPHCSRKFNQAAAERHIPRCKDLKTKKPNFNTRKR